MARHDTPATQTSIQQAPHIHRLSYGRALQVQDECVPAADWLLAAHLSHQSFSLSATRSMSWPTVRMRSLSGTNQRCWKLGS